MSTTSRLLLLERLVARPFPSGYRIASFATRANPKDKKNLSKQSANQSVESVYQKKSQREHVLLRPEPYIGSTQWEKSPTWVIEDGSGANKSKKDKSSTPLELCVVQAREVSFVPAIVQLFDEILVNACDNRHRRTIGRRSKSKLAAISNSAVPSTDSMTQIRVSIDSVANKIVVFNDGPCVPVVMHSKEKMYVPSLVFGHLLTSSNYDDTQVRFVFFLSFLNWPSLSVAFLWLG